MVVLCARVCMYVCVKGHSRSKEKPNPGGAEIRGLRQLKGSCRTTPVPQEKQRGPIRPSAHRLEGSKKPRKGPGESRAAIRSLWRWVERQS